MISGPFFILFYIFIGIILLAFAYGLFSLGARKKAPHRDAPRKGQPGSPGVCPVCNSVLESGQQIKSVLYPGKKDRICHIFGCPNCHPYSRQGVSRGCPVCKKKLPEEEYLVARLFERDGGKRHVHILGCTGCRLTSKNDRYRG